VCRKRQRKRYLVNNCWRALPEPVLKWKTESGKLRALPAPTCFMGSPTHPVWRGEEEPRSEQAVSNLIRRLSEVRDDE
jgi:hypothetical protein